MSRKTCFHSAPSPFSPSPPSARPPTKCSRKTSKRWAARKDQGIAVDAHHRHHEDGPDGSAVHDHEDCAPPTRAWISRSRG